MMTRLLTVVAGLAVLAAPGAAQAQQEDGAKAVRAVLDAQVAAWNKGDLPGFMEGYWKSPELTFYSGNKVTRGWDATLERYQKRYQGEGREMGKLAFRDLEIQVFGAEHAVVRGRFVLTLKKDTAEGLFTLVVRKIEGKWRIVHDHTSS
jgi:beta-aspartyl-peptidase (threonine type)